MDDFTYDCAQKKRIARGAFNMKRGSKSRKCSLPSDHLTPKQLKERNGPVMKYTMNAPMSWEVFKSMPLDLQQKYLDSLFSRFNVGSSIISRDLFNQSSATLGAYAKRKGLKSPCGERLSTTEREVWESWLYPSVPQYAEEFDEPEEETEEPVEETPETPPEKCEEAPEIPPEKCEKPEEPKPFSPGGVGGLHDFLFGFRKPEPEVTKPLDLSHLSATFKGEFEPERFLQWITKLPMPEGNVRIQVEVTAQ